MKSLIWKIQRMQVMGPVELGVRATREVQNLLEYLLLSRGLSFRPSGKEIAGGAGASGFPFEGEFFFDPEDELLRSRLNPLPAAYLKEAEEAIAHRVSVLGQKYDLGERIDWHYDYRLSRRCPVLYWSLIDLKNPDSEESIRWVWYLNRHKHLAALGRAYFVTRKREYAQEIITQLCEWIEQNPPCVGVNWAASLEIALRLFSWLWAIFPLRRFDGFTPEVERILMQSMVLQMRHMARNLSVYSSANNHLIAQGMTLLVGGTLLSRVPGAAKWKKKGSSILWKEIFKQTFPDGVSKEQSLHYHCFVTELYAIVLLFAEKNGIEVPQSVKQQFVKMCDFLLSISTKDGRVPDIGDSDDQTVLLPEGAARLFESLMACASYLTGREEFIQMATEIAPEAALLLGKDGFERLRERIKAATQARARGWARASRAFSEGGYYILSDTHEGIESHCVFDCGELGLGRTAAHGHADCLSVTLSVNGRGVLIDPGTFSYHSQPKWRAYFRSTSAHNTVTIDGRSQSEMGGPFVWRTKAVPHIDDVAMESCFDFVAGSHDGYLRLRDPVKHKRVVVFVKPTFFIIVDVLIGEGSHEYEQNFHFGGKAALSRKTGSVKIRADDDASESLLFSPFLTKEEGMLVSGQGEPILGWRSQRFWQKTACDCLSIKGKFKGTLLLESCIVNAASWGSEKESICFSGLGPEARLHSLVKRRTSLFHETSLINLHEGQAGEECLRSDASYLCLREFSANGALEIFGRNVGQVLRNGELLLESTERFDFIRVKIEKETVAFEARGVGSVLVRAESASRIVSSLPGLVYKRQGEFLRITACP